MTAYGTPMPELTRTDRDIRAETIRVERARRKLKQADVAELAGLNQATIAKAEAGRAGDDAYDRIETALGLAS